MPALRERTLKPGLKSTLVKMIGLSAISVAALTACGKKEEAAAPAPAASTAA